MNQAILFSDELSWNQQAQSVDFSAQCMGALIECRVTASLLEKLTQVKVVDEKSAVEAFELCRFDIEEQAEQLIEEEEYDANGRIVLN